MDDTIIDTELACYLILLSGRNTRGHNKPAPIGHLDVESEVIR